MLKISKGNPYVFWPSSICDTFPENPANKFLTGEVDFAFEIEFILKDTSSLQKTVFTLIPRFTGMDIYPDKTLFTATFQDETKVYNINQIINVDEYYKIRLENVPNKHLRLFINNEVVVEENLDNKCLGVSDSPHIVFGAGNFPKNDFNLNYLDMELYAFRVFHNNELLADHDFKYRIHDKFVDRTDNLNFIHKL